jgi:hypothetical protein
MRGERGQATVEWVALLLVVALALSAVVAASGAVGASWLPGRLACGLLGGACSGERPAADWRTASGRLRVPVESSGGAVAVVSAPAAVASPVASFIVRNGKTIRKVAIATAIGTGVAAACAGAVAAANAIGAVACGSSIVTGGYAAYHNATD